MIKKANAILSLLTLCLLVVHAGYQTVSYLLFFYNPVATAVTGMSLEAAFVLHAILSAISVFGAHDSKTISYKKLNIGTVLQRITAVLMIVLLPPHIAFSVLLNKGVVPKQTFYIIIAVQILFYGAICTHVAVSFSKALISLGWLVDDDKRKKIDRTVAVICAVLFVIIAVIISWTQLILVSQV